eukprot:4345603-Pyramimonas_sp.AAC.1
MATQRQLRSSNLMHSPHSQATLHLGHAFEQSEHTGLRYGPAGCELILGIGSPPAAGALVQRFSSDPL